MKTTEYHLYLNNMACVQHNKPNYKGGLLWTKNY